MTPTVDRGREDHRHDDPQGVVDEDDEAKREEAEAHDPI
jgi:hypothetical protein